MNPGDTNTRPGEAEPQAPAKLAAALKEPSPRRVFVPPAIDAAVLAAARKHLGAPASRRPALPWWLLWPTLATACVVLVGLIFHRHPATFAREDVNRDGR